MQDTSRSSRDNVYCQASFSEEAWSLTVRIMNLFEQGEIKEQKLSVRQLTSKLDFKKDRLHQFLGLNFAKQVPQAFVAYCQAAMQALSRQVSWTCTPTTVLVHMCVEKDILTLNYGDIRSVSPFMGAHLFLAHIPQVLIFISLIMISNKHKHLLTSL